MYPLVLNVHGRLAVVVGGGAVAERKIAALLEAGAVVRAVAPRTSPELARLWDDGRIAWERKLFQPSDLDGAILAFAATNDDAVNANVVAAARERGILVNDASDAARGDFATPAVHRSGAITVAVDTGGMSPSVSKLVRDEIGGFVDKRFANALVCASRSSPLAMVQTRTVMAKLARSGIASTVVHISTKGDEVQDRALASIGTDSIFVKELELALRERRADYAVHSCKDLPSTLPEDMELTAIVERADPRDIFCSDRFPSFAELPTRARVGTSSPRRRAQLEAMRADLDYVTIRGNVDTRLRKLRAGEYDAIVLAAAGLGRLGMRATYTVPFGLDEIVPAVGQGALAVETRRDDETASVLRAVLNDAARELEVVAERAFLRTMRGGCQAPIGANASLTASKMIIRAAVRSDGSRRIARAQRTEVVTTREQAEAAGVALALEIAPLGGRLFLLARTQDRPSRIAPALREAGAEVVEAADSRGARHALADRTPHVILFPSSGSVGAIADYLRELPGDRPRPLVAAMGPASGAAAEAQGWAPDIVSPNAEIVDFVAAVTRYVLEDDGARKDDAR